MSRKPADHYTVANHFGSISQSHQCAISLIEKAHLGQTLPYQILDLSVGNGDFLKMLYQSMPAATFTGIDVSKKMLDCASSALPLTTIETSATEASQYIAPKSQDLVLAHFINAYIPFKQLCHEAHLLTRTHGHFLLITTTYESFPNTQQQLAHFISSDSILSNIVGHYYKAIVKNTTVATGEEELQNAFKINQFQILSHERLHIPITLHNIDELALFGIEGTWFLNTVAIRMLPKHFLIQRLKRLFGKIFTFPYEDTHIIDVVLAQRLDI